jgi:hypothetical protein
MTRHADEICKKLFGKEPQIRPLQGGMSVVHARADLCGISLINKMKSEMRSERGRQAAENLDFLLIVMGRLEMILSKK